MSIKRRGIADAIVDIDSVHDSADDQLLDLDPQVLEENPANPRRHFDDVTLQELADSIQKVGVIEPLVAVRLAEHGRYMLIAGHRRRRAAIMVGVDRVKVLVRADLSPEDALALAIIENDQRDDLTVMDRARSYQAWIDLVSQGEGAPTRGVQRLLSKKISKSETYVSRHLALLALPADVRQLAEDLVVIDRSKLIALGSLDDDERTQAIAQIRSRRDTNDDFVIASNAVDDNTSDGSPRKPPTKSPPANVDPNVAHLEQRISEALATVATIKTKSNGTSGELRLKFHSLDELDGILERLGIEERA